MLLLSDRYYGVSISGVPKPVQKVLPPRGTYGILSPDSNRGRDVRVPEVPTTNWTEMCGITGLGQ